MRIQLISGKYHFNGGEAALLPHDWVSRAGQDDSFTSFWTGRCAGNRIDDVPELIPGEYVLFLMDATVEFGQAAHRSFHTLQPWALRITAEDVTAGQCQLLIPDAGLYTMTFSRGGQPPDRGRVTIYLEMQTSEITTDATGSIAILGDPREYVLGVEEAYAMQVNQVTS